MVIFLNTKTRAHTLFMMHTFVSIPARTSGEKHNIYSDVTTHSRHVPIMESSYLQHFSGSDRKCRNWFGGSVLFFWQSSMPLTLNIALPNSSEARKCRHWNRFSKFQMHYMKHYLFVCFFHQVFFYRKNIFATCFAVSKGIPQHEFIVTIVMGFEDVWNIFLFHHFFSWKKLICNIDLSVSDRECPIQDLILEISDVVLETTYASCLTWLLGRT